MLRYYYRGISSSLLRLDVAKSTGMKDTPALMTSMAIV